jgi:O-antigen/teichoic acid export membrane protein
VVGLSAGAQFFVGLFSVLLPGIYFAKEVKYVSLVQVVTALIAIGFNLLFIPLLGLLGAAITLMFSFLAMAVLMQLWNLKRKDSYLEVKYEWNRIRWFVLIYLGCAVFTLWERSLPWFTEVTLSVILLIFLPIMLYAFLNSYERQYLWVIAKYFIPKRFKHQYTKV